MKHLLAAAVILTVSLLCLPLVASGQGEESIKTGTVTAIPCPIAVPDTVQVECGALQVPENYADPEGATLSLPYILLHSNNPNPASDPLLFTAGGPGRSSLDSIWRFVNSSILEERDVIVFEQRGNRYAQPTLFCDNSSWWDATLDNTPCLDGLLGKGIDIAQYNTHNIVQDIKSLRQAFGYKQWNLIGGSFSTVLMLKLMELDPGGVRSVILESVKPPHETTFDHEADSALQAIQQMFADCAADSQCAAAYPDLEIQFYELIRKLNQSPLEVKVISSLNNESIPISIDGSTFIDWIVVDHLYRPAFPPFGTAYLPLLIREVSQGNLAPLQSIVQAFWSGMAENPYWSWGLHLAINCQQELPAARSSRPPADLAASETLDGFARYSRQREICAAWDLPALPPAATDYISSDLPALVLAGSYDPVTPPAWSKATADHLANSTYVEFTGHGHELAMDNPCLDKLQAEFLHAPLEILDISCVRETKQASFVLREDLFITPGLASSYHDVSLGDPQGTGWIEALSVISLLVMLVSLIALVIYGLVWWKRSRETGAGWDKTAAVAYFLSLVLILSELAVPFLVSRINNEYFGRNLILYSFGPSRDFGPAALLAWISPLIGLLLLVLAILTTWAWLIRRWPLPLRILTTLVVIASLMIVFLGLRWGLFTMLV